MSQERHDGLVTAKALDKAMPSPDVNHELRTFLHSIIGYIELLQEDAAAQGYDNLAPELGKILLASNHLAALVEERFLNAPTAYRNMNLEPTSLSRESAGKWLRDRILAPSQQQQE